MDLGPILGASISSILKLPKKSNTIEQENVPHKTSNKILISKLAVIGFLHPSVL